MRKLIAKNKDRFYWQWSKLIEITIKVHFKISAKIKNLLVWLKKYHLSQLKKFFWPSIMNLYYLKMTYWKNLIQRSILRRQYITQWKFLILWKSLKLLRRKCLLKLSTGYGKNGLLKFRLTLSFIITIMIRFNNL